MTDLTRTSSYARSRRHLWLYRVLAVVLSLSVFCLIELVCRLGGWGDANVVEDPFVGFHEIRPLFVLDEDRTHYKTATARRKFFAPDSFPAKKARKTFRIFCLGGSTVQGRPFSIETSFTTWLRLALETADPDRTWEVVNCGGISYASYRLVPILKECLRYEPDLFIVCTGHNEFLEDRTYADIKTASPFWTRTQTLLSRSRGYSLLRDSLLSLTGQTQSKGSHRSILSTDVDAWLDYKNGLDAYHWDEAWRAGIVTHFEINLRRMCDLTRQAGVPLLFIRPPSNLRDCPPFKSQHRGDFGDVAKDAWQAAIDAAHECTRNDVDAAIRHLRDAISLDPQYAATYYELGKCLVATHRLDEAHEAFETARELDICPLRMITPLATAMFRVTRETGTPLIDAHALLETRDSDGILGGFWLVDHIHPSFQGHQVIAVALAEFVLKQCDIDPTADWKPRREKAFAAHLKTLDDLYFLHGQRTLECLQAWTQGQADGPPLAEHVGADE